MGSVFPFVRAVVKRWVIIVAVIVSVSVVAVLALAAYSAIRMASYLESERLLHMKQIVAQVDASAAIRENREGFASALRGVDSQSKEGNAGLIDGKTNGATWWAWIVSDHPFQGRTCFRSADGKLYWLRTHEPSDSDKETGLPQKGAILIP